MKYLLLWMLIGISCVGCNNITSQFTSECQENVEEYRKTHIDSYGNTYFVTYYKSKKVLVMKVNREKECVFQLSNTYELSEDKYKGDIFTAVGVGYTLDEQPKYINYFVDCDGKYACKEILGSSLKDGTKEILNSSLDSIFANEKKLSELCDEELYREVTNLVLLLKNQQLDVFLAVLDTCDYQMDIKSIVLDIYLKTLRCSAYIQ